MIYKFNKTTELLEDFQTYLTEWASMTMTEKLEEENVWHPLVLKYNMADIFDKAKKRTAYLLRGMSHEDGTSRFLERFTDAEKDLFEENLNLAGMSLSADNLSPYSKSYMNSYQFRIKDGTLAVSGYAYGDHATLEGFYFNKYTYPLLDSKYEVWDDITNLDVKMWYDGALQKFTVAQAHDSNPSATWVTIEINETLPQTTAGNKFEVWEGDGDTEYLSFNFDLPRLYDLNMVNQLEDAVEKYLISSALTLTFEAMSMDDLMVKEALRAEGYDETVVHLLNRRTHGIERRSTLI